MATRRVHPTRRAAAALALALGLALPAAPGCANRRAARPSPSTLGSDLLRAPAGTTTPPPSLGVDLVSHRENR